MTSFDLLKKMIIQHRMKLLGMVALLGCLGWACRPQPPGIQVAVAANLLLPMQEIAAAFEAKEKLNIHLIPASSGVLTAQIRQQAPFDLFFSANARYPRQLYEEGYGAEAPLVLVRGHLVFWSKHELPTPDVAASLPTLASGHLALAHPELAPYGSLAKNWLEQHHLWQMLQPRLVFGENVGQVNQYIYTGAVDAAFTANSAMYAPELRPRGYWTPLETTTDIPHSLLITKGARPESRRFVDFLRSETARNIFRAYGYASPPAP